MNKKIVILGGGTGMSGILSNLKDFPLDITGIITVSDNGRSTGKLRDEFLTPAVGDIRKVLTNLSDLPQELKDIMEYRFNTYSDLNGHPLGNLVLTALLNKNYSLKQSIDYMRQLLKVKPNILPLSEDYLTLMGETLDGEIIEGEADLTKSKHKYKRIFYKEKPHVLKECLTAIKEADLIIISMGSLYTSILPHLLCQEIVEEIQKTKSSIMYLCNAMTQPGETDNFTVSDHINLINQYIDKRKIDVVVASNSKINNTILEKYLVEEQKDPVIIDKEQIKKLGTELIESDLITTIDNTVRHNGMKLSSIIFSYLMR